MDEFDPGRTFRDLIVAEPALTFAGIAAAAQLLTVAGWARKTAAVTVTVAAGWATRQTVTPTATIGDLIQTVQEAVAYRSPPAPTDPTAG